MNKIFDLQWAQSPPRITWGIEGENFEHVFAANIESVLLLKHSSGIAIVAGGEALVLNDDGTERFRLRNPYPPEKDFSFYYFNYVNDELTVVLAGRGIDFAFVVDEATGKYLRSFETR